MSQTIPGKGLTTGISAVETGIADVLTGPDYFFSADGSWRPDVPFDTQEGIRVTLRAEKGVTDPDYLKVPFRFQCPPLSAFTRPLSVPWPTFETLSAMERSRPQGAALRIWQFDTMFVWDHEEWVIWTGAQHAHGHGKNRVNARSGVFEPQLFLRELEEIATHNVIFRLVVDEPVVWAQSLINSLAVITGVTPTIKSGESTTEYVTMVLQEFRDLTVGQPGRSAATSVGNPSTVKVSSTDTLYELARKLLGKPSDWRRFAAINGISNVNPNDPGALSAWMAAHHKATLKVPPQQKHAKMPSAAAMTSKSIGAALR